MLGIIFGLLAAIGQGLGYALLKKSFDDRAASLAYFADMVFGLLIWIPVGLLLGVSWGQFGTVMWYALLSALLAEAFVFFVLAKGGAISLTQPVFATYPLFTLLFSRFVNGDVLTLPVMLAISITIIGILVLAFPTEFTKEELQKRALLLWPLLGAIAVGISDSLSKNIIDAVSPGTFLFALALAQVPIALGYLLIEKVPIKSAINMYRRIKEYKYSFAGSFAIVSTLVFFWLAFTYSLASIASPITATYVVFTLLFSVLIVKEKISKKDAVGITLAIMGILSLSYLVA